MQFPPGKEDADDRNSDGSDDDNAELPDDESAKEYWRGKHLEAMSGEMVGQVTGEAGSELISWKKDDNEWFWAREAQVKMPMESWLTTDATDAAQSARDGDLQQAADADADAKFDVGF